MNLEFNPAGATTFTFDNTMFTLILSISALSLLLFTSAAGAEPPPVKEAEWRDSTQEEQATIPPKWRTAFCLSHKHNGMTASSGSIQVPENSSVTKATRTQLLNDIAGGLSKRAEVTDKDLEHRDEVSLMRLKTVGPSPLDPSISRHLSMLAIVNKGKLAILMIPRDGEEVTWKDKALTEIVNNVLRAEGDPMRAENPEVEDGADQPATAPESKSEAKEKPEPAPEGRSR